MEQVQTKFTSVGGQDLDDMPYSPQQSMEDQIRSSLASSIHNLRSDELEIGPEPGEHYIDCLLLHSPMRTMKGTLLAWKVLEEFVPRSVHHLGISNVDVSTLAFLYDNAVIKPAVVQRRFYPKTRFDIHLRRYCVEKGIIYQAFWTLTANPGLLIIRSS